MSRVSSTDSLQYVWILSIEVKDIFILDERQVIGNRVLHCACVICIECQKSIGDGAFEEVVHQD